ncbi:hypothetical protein PtB15_8B20 [Puccinia triticina]|nr:hypothetical protein PtB15_8B20 [Puccinia triticina]
MKAFKASLKAKLDVSPLDFHFSTVYGIDEILQLAKNAELIGSSWQAPIMIPEDCASDATLQPHSSFAEPVQPIRTDDGSLISQLNDALLLGQTIECESPLLYLPNPHESAPVLDSLKHAHPSHYHSFQVGSTDAREAKEHQSLRPMKRQRLYSDALETTTSTSANPNSPPSVASARDIADEEFVASLLNDPMDFDEFGQRLFSDFPEASTSVLDQSRVVPASHHQLPADSSASRPNLDLSGQHETGIDKPRTRQIIDLTGSLKVESTTGESSSTYPTSGKELESLKCTIT